nr:MAG TPA: hypothetical protein [Herelleviridae sp.]
MLRRINNIDDLKAELTRYFETMRAIPAPKRPGYAKNYLWEMAKDEQTPEEIDSESRFCPTQVDIADCWYVCENFMPLLSRFEYKLLAARLSEKPLPWKILEREHKTSRQMLHIYMEKALKRLFVQMKS